MGSAPRSGVKCCLRHSRGGIAHQAGAGPDKVGNAAQYPLELVQRRTERKSVGADIKLADRRLVLPGSFLDD